SRATRLRIAIAAVKARFRPTRSATQPINGLNSCSATRLSENRIPVSVRLNPNLRYAKSGSVKLIMPKLKRDKNPSARMTRREGERERGREGEGETEGGREGETERGGEEETEGRGAGERISGSHSSCLSVSLSLWSPTLPLSLSPTLPLSPSLSLLLTISAVFQTGGRSVTLPFA